MEEINIIIAGDFTTWYGRNDAVEYGDFVNVCSPIKPFFDSADYSIVNLECPIIEGNEKPIRKNGPHLRGSFRMVEALHYLGVDCVTLANNHFRDFGIEGCTNTFNRLHDYSISHVGGGHNIDEASSPLYVTVKERRIAFLNFCENEFSIAGNDSAGSSPLDLIENYRQITAARLNADYVVVIVHGGNEHYQLPSPRMKKTYRWFVELGADAVINHHQHCFSGYEIYQDKPIVYGIGNFYYYAPRRINSMWNDGYLAQLVFSDKVSVNAIPYKQCNGDCRIRPMTQSERCVFDEDINRLNNVIADDKILSDYFSAFCESKMKVKEASLTPWNGKLSRFLFCRGFLPSLIGKKRKLSILNFVECEAQRDLLLYYLKNNSCK